MTMQVSRFMLIGLALLWAGYNIVLAVVTLEAHSVLWTAIAAIACYVLGVALALLGTGRWLQLPLLAALGVAALGLGTVLFGVQGLDPAAPLGYATWFVGGYGVLMTIIMTRRQPWVAWSGIVVLVALLGVWSGPGGILSLGALGPVAWVLVAQLILLGLRSAERDARLLAEAEQEASNWQALQEAVVAERVVRLQQTERRARPLLERIVSSKGVLGAEDRVQSLHLEAALRDEIRGRGLLTDKVREAVQVLRQAGTRVLLLDEGGLDDVPVEERTAVLEELAELLAAAQADHVTVRTSPVSGPLVTVVGIRGDEDDEDDDFEVTLRQGLGRVAPVAAE